MNDGDQLVMLMLQQGWKPGSYMDVRLNTCLDLNGYVVSS